MNKRTSLFSFNTVKIPRKYDRELFICLVIVLAANLWVGVMGARGRLFAGNPVVLIDKLIKQMEEKHDTWLVGNSTLHGGVDEEMLKNQGVDCVKLVLGGSTLKAMVALTLRGLDRTSHPPKSIVVFISKDDLNSKGKRSQTSKKYFTAIKGHSLADELLFSIPVHSYRYSVRKFLKNKLGSLVKIGKDILFKKKTKPQNANPGSEKWKVYSAGFDDIRLNRLGKNFTLDIKSLEILARKCSPKNIDLYLVVVPMSPAVFYWQKKNIPDTPWSGIIASIKNKCTQNDIYLLDHSNALPSTSQYFVNSDHTKIAGRDKWTPRLIVDLKALFEKRL